MFSGDAHQNTGPLKTPVQKEPSWHKSASRDNIQMQPQEHKN